MTFCLLIICCDASPEPDNEADKSSNPRAYATAYTDTFPGRSPGAHTGVCADSEMLILAWHKPSIAPGPMFLCPFKVLENCSHEPQRKPLRHKAPFERHVFTPAHLFTQDDLACGSPRLWYRPQHQVACPPEAPLSSPRECPQVSTRASPYANLMHSLILYS